MNAAVNAVLRRRGGLSVGLILAGVAASAVVGVPAAAAVPSTLHAAEATARKCHGGRVAARSTDGFAFTPTVNGLLRVRLLPVDASARSTDWDLAVFGPDRLVAASAGPRSYELADGYVHRGERVWVQGCRIAGAASRVKVSVAMFQTSDWSGATTQLVSVNVPTAVARARLQALGLDQAESGSADRVDLVLHGDADQARLRAAGLRWQVKIADLAAQQRQTEAADRTYAAATARSALPSGRTGYRRLADYEYEMKELARRHPDLVKLDVLSRSTVEGRDIVAIEITQHAANVADGKPIFLNLGELHAREWPSGELPMEFAYDLINGYGHDARTTRLVRRARTIVLPVTNPDGFSVSRQAPLQGGSEQFDYSFKRKNCDPAAVPSALRSGVCPVNPAGIDLGVDLNRNFGGFWGGPGSSEGWGNEDHRGAAPFSEPETQAIRELASGRQITNVIGNHTAGDLVLRPPGLSSTGQPVDDPLLTRLARSMAAQNGYGNFRIFQLYDATGSTDDWFYWVSGALSTSLEIGLEGFHPAFASGVVAEYLGRAPAAGAGKGGNRGAYFAMLESTARAADHATLVGRAPSGWTLRLRKQVTTPTSPIQHDDGSTGPALTVTDRFDSTLRTPGGTFSWAVNPSTRPYVAGRYGRTPAAPPQATAALANPPGHPALNENGDPFGGPREIVPFTIAAPPTADNGRATVKITWSKPDTSWFLFVFDDQGSLVGQSYPFGETSAEIDLVDPVPGRYTAVIENFQQADAVYDDWSGAVSFASPQPAVAGTDEAWTLSCERPDGRVVTTRKVVIDRGRRLDVRSVCSAKAGPATRR